MKMKKSYYCLLVFGMAVFLLSSGYSGTVAKAQTANSAEPSPVTEKKNINTSAKTKEESTLKTQKEKINYAIGVQMIGNFKRQGMEIDLDLIMKGMRDAFAGNQLLLSDGELRKAMMIYQKQAIQRMAKAKTADAENNKKEGDAFLAQNKGKQGVVTLPSGLQYRVIKNAEGKKPTGADTVDYNYRGTLVNGTEFDSSRHTGKPATFKVSGVIPGLQEALKVMPVGSTWQIVVPSQLGYGQRGNGSMVGPNAVLIFEVELLAIK